VGKIAGKKIGENKSKIGSSLVVGGGKP